MLAKTELDKPHDCLRRAADHIEKKGWWPGPVRDPKMKGKACAMLAIRYITDNDELFNRCVTLLAQKINIDKGEIPLWNDKQPDAEPVIQALREAAYS